MYQIMLVFHVIVACLLIGLVLIQHGKGAQAGAAFGSGASQTIFGSQGSGGFLSRATGILAAIFFIINLFLAYWINKSAHEVSIPTTERKIEQNKAPTTSAQPPKGEDVPEVQ